MALQSSGQIKLSEIAAEFGGSEPHALSEYHDKGNAPASGEIQLAADFYGTSDFTPYTIAYLAIAGGASGAAKYTGQGAGGGGAGGRLTGNLTEIASAGSVITITVGGGGASKTRPGHPNGANGSNSTITEA